MQEAPRIQPEHSSDADMRSEIVREWDAFAELAGQPDIQQLCSIYSRYTQDHGGGDVLSVLRLKSQEEPFTTTATVMQLSVGEAILEQFMAGVAWAHCDLKKAVEPQTPAERAVVLRKVLNGGIGRVFKYINHSETAPDENMHAGNADQVICLSLTLVLLAARLKAAELGEAVAENGVGSLASSQEIDDRVDASLQDACVHIIENARTPTPKGISQTDHLVVATANFLRTIYHYGKDASFKRDLFNAFIFSYEKHTKPAGNYPSYNIYLQQYRKTMFEYFSADFNELIGTDFAPLDDAQLSNMFGERQNDIHVQDGGVMSEDKRQEVLIRLFTTQVTRLFVDAIARGDIKCSVVLRAMRRLHEWPFKGREGNLLDIGEEHVDWEILPMGHYGTRDDELDPVQHDEQLRPRLEPNRARIERLKEYVTSWGDGFIARSNIPRLRGEQYYVAVLPEVGADGTTMYHAVADHPGPNNAVYVWRAERGLSDDGRHITWQEVFSRDKRIASQLGARRFYHSKNVETNVLDYLTCPVSELTKWQRYLLGRMATGLSAAE